MKRLLISTLGFLLFCEATDAQLYYLSGKVTNSRLEPMGFVTVKVLNQTGGTVTNEKGEYRIALYNDRYEVIYSFIGYRTEKAIVVINGKNVVQNFIMREDESVLEDMVVKSTREDPSERIIRQAIRVRDKYKNSPVAYTSTVYIKATLEDEVNSKSRKKQKDSLGKDLGDTLLRSLQMAELQITRHFQSPNKIKEITEGKKLRGSTLDLFYLSTTTGDFNFYNNLVTVPQLSESPFLSPISYGGLIAYKYRYDGFIFEDGLKVHKIRVTPGLMGNALVSGTIEIIDELWCIKRFEFNFPKYHVVKYDNFTLKQEYVRLEDSVWVINRQEFSYVNKTKKSKMNGRTVVNYNNINLHPVYPRNFFGDELSITTKEAYERDSAFWNTVRTEPLNEKELDHIKKTDSIQQAHSSKEYLDSIDRDFNKITIQKVALFGQGYYNRQTETRILFKPLMFLLQPVNIAGPRLDYWFVYEKTLKDKRNFVINPNANYGLNNKDLKGSLSFAMLYDPFRRGEFYIDGGKDFEIINPYESWINIFRRSNFYQHNYVNFWHRIELINGLYFKSGIELADRRSISNYKFDPLADSLFNEPNKVIAFSPYTAFYGLFELTWVPRQKYLREPYEKVILGSKFPHFTLKYRKGIPGVFNSAINFDYLEFNIAQEFKIGLAGVSKYRFTTGSFVNQRSLRYVDYQYQRRGAPILFSNPLFSFQLLDSSFPVFKPYYQFHYFHRFNGAILNKIPILKKLNLIETAGGGALYAPERNLQYVEGFIGIERVFRFFKERYKLGFYACTAWANTYQTPFQLKFTIEYFDRRSNTWPY